ncbi:helix-turn-helix domain-containing protein [Porticoccus sp. GXU_MW_L64]
MAQAALIDAYQDFMHIAQSYLIIRNEADYEGAVQTLEEILEEASDTVDDPLNPLIELLSQAIESYESQDAELVAFLEEAESIPTDIALLRSLMQQHQLTGSDLPEIGDKTMVSKVLNGKRTLQRDAIEKLADRFGIRPSMFLGG